ncbi:hypothetical protein V6N11_050449 [Hibiscus sabdariffa]|uniref:Uncharacterized protein n=1 Tax=Hibiscus sabdariffa TaxID=183260 RepID=A0ABR2T9U6_9ROSI
MGALKWNPSPQFLKSPPPPSLPMPPPLATGGRRFDSPLTSACSPPPLPLFSPFRFPRATFKGRENCPKAAASSRRRRYSGGGDSMFEGGFGGRLGGSNGGELVKDNNSGDKASVDGLDKTEL